MFIVVWGRYKVLLYVWVVGINEFDIFVKLIEGCSLNFSIGFWLVSEINCNTWFSVIVFFLLFEVIF